jgi:hypothetical protein
VQQAPGIPCALYFFGRTILEKLGRIAPRERGVVFSGSHVIAKHVIASEAKQSIVTAHAERWIASLRSQ